MRVIGMMSGTSVDGIDVAIAEITESSPSSASKLNSRQEPQVETGTSRREKVTGKEKGDRHTRPPQVDAYSDAIVTIEQLTFATIPWPEEIRRQIFALFHETTTAADLCRTNFAIANVFADAALRVLHDAEIDLQSVDLIASHGQTIWHDVLEGKVTSTLQLGDPSVIATRTGITTIGNFRTADVAAGGQGAPLVSLYDWYFLRPRPLPSSAEDGSQQETPSGWRAIQNIGGIGNVTFLPPHGNEEDPLAFDTGPGNVFIDWATELATGGQQRFDRDGQLAATGQVPIALLEHYLALPYFHIVPPKSTGRELFDNSLAAEWWAFAAQMGATPVDFIATMTELTAMTIADAYRRFAPGAITEVVVAGGGARNPVLLSSISRHLQQKFERPIPVQTHQELGIDDKAKEALAFALMGYLAVQGKVGNVPSCTGARKAQILGQIAPGDNYRLLLQNL